MDFRNKKVLVMGLGKLGGGVATARWFVKQDAKVTVTDLRTRRELAPSIRALGSAAKKIKFVLGKHRLIDFRKNDLVVANPAVPRESPYLAAARRAGKEIVNDAKIFFDIIQNPVIAVTGTRGKTTTTNWLAYFIRARHRGVAAAGNTPELPLFALIDRLRGKKTPAVLELSSWQLELLDEVKRAPDVALITNLYRDHMNRYRGGMRDYARAKANIFARQTNAQNLILNADNAWTPFFLKQKPHARIFFFSLKPLPKNRDGICISENHVLFKNGRRHEEILNKKSTKAFLGAHGSHNLQNFLAASLAAHLAGIPWRAIRARIATLPIIPFREEIIVKQKGLMAVNDSAATSPDGVIAALARFASANLILITGGTDKKLEFAEWARAVKRHVQPENLFLLEGSATDKMVRALKRVNYFRRAARQNYPQLFAALPEIVGAVKQKVSAGAPFTVLFSPGAASFEKFQNEFDRGRKFNLYWKQNQS